MHGQRIAIYCFSGTGNTEFVVQLLAAEMESRGCQVEVTPITVELIRRTQAAEIDTSEYDLVGIAHPVHGWNAPRLVDEFLRVLPIADDKPTFLLRTAGDELLNGGATSHTRRLLRARGYKVYNEPLLVMPSNLFVATPEDQGRRMIEAVRGRVPGIAEEIAARRENLARNAVGNRIFSRSVGALEQRGARLFGRRLRVSEACTRCGVCVRRCPAENITMSPDQPPRFGWSCLMCLRCVYACPVAAIHHPFWGFAILKEGYDLARYLESPEASGQAASSPPGGGSIDLPTGQMP